MLTINLFMNGKTDNIAAATSFNKLNKNNSKRKEDLQIGEFSFVMNQAGYKSSDSGFYNKVYKSFVKTVKPSITIDQYILGYAVSTIGDKPFVVAFIGNQDDTFYSAVIYYATGAHYKTMFREFDKAAASKSGLMFTFNFFAPVKKTVKIGNDETQPAAPEQAQAVAPKQTPVEVVAVQETPVQVESDEYTEKLIAEERTERSNNIHEKTNAELQNHHQATAANTTKLTDIYQGLRDKTVIDRANIQKQMIANKPDMYTEDFKLKKLPFELYRITPIKDFMKSREVYKHYDNGIDYPYQVMRLTDELAEKLGIEEKAIHLRPFNVNGEMHYVLVKAKEKYSHGFKPCREDLEMLDEQRRQRDLQAHKKQTAASQDMISLAIAQKKKNDERRSQYETETKKVTELANMVKPAVWEDKPEITQEQEYAQAFSTDFDKMQESLNDDFFVVDELLRMELPTKKTKLGDY